VIAPYYNDNLLEQFQEQIVRIWIVAYSYSDQISW